MSNLKAKGIIVRTAGIVFALLLTFASAVLLEVFANSDVENMPQKNNTRIYKPEFEIIGGNNLGIYSSGKSQQFDISLKNISKHTANKMQIQLIPSKEDEKIFTSSMFTWRNLNIRPGNKYTAEMPFTLNDAAEQKTYDMTLRLTFSNIHNDSYTQDIPVYMSVQNKSLAPVLGVVKTETERNIVDSQSPQKLKLTIRNGGDLRALNGVVTIKGFDQKGVYLVNDINTRKIDTLAKTMFQTISFDVMANQSVDKNWELEVNIKYLDDMNKVYEKTQTILVPTQLSESNGDLSTIKLAFSKSNYEIYGEGKSTASLSVTNTGKTDVEKLNLKLSAEGGVKFMSKYVDLIEKIKPGQTLNYSYSMVSADASQEGNFPITATLKSGNGENAKQTIQVAGVTCYKKDDEKNKGGKKPKIIIADYKHSGDKILAGKEFDLRVVLKNTSQSIGVKNLKVTFASEESIFIPINAANSFFIESIGPGESKEHIIRLKSKPDAAAKMYNITFTGEYEDHNGVSYDEKGNPYKSEELIALNVKQEIRLEIPSVKIQETAFLEDHIPIEVEFYNMGKAPLFNTVVKLEGDFESDNSNYYVGNFESAKSDIFNAKIKAKKAGELKGKVIVSFEDESGNREERVKEFKVQVSEGSGVPNGAGGEMGGFGEMKFDENGNPLDENGNPIVPPSEGLPIWAIILIALAVIGAIAGIVVLKKRKRKRLEQALLEEDDED